MLSNDSVRAFIDFTVDSGRIWKSLSIAILQLEMCGVQSLAVKQYKRKL